MESSYNNSRQRPSQRDASSRIHGATKGNISMYVSSTCVEVKRPGSFKRSTSSVQRSLAREICNAGIATGTALGAQLGEAVIATSVASVSTMRTDCNVYNEFAMAVQSATSLVHITFASAFSFAFSFAFAFAFRFCLTPDIPKQNTTHRRLRG